ncbi:exportin-4-like [Ischnura elegans]|uniref:exportin-4-like n=1 Tax=Ischnura elegans TaxID=197161 RepID=UPI001ED89A79|nr:exportin-4-like [Ischnura elegans]
MAGQAIKELETAAQVLLAPPNVVNNEQRHAAEAVFLNFKKTKSPYNICREILETSTNDYVLFEAASVLKDALIREWSTLQENDLTSLRQYLLHYVMEKTSLPSFVRERIVQVAAIMVKRSSVEDFGCERGQILNEVQNLILSGDPPRQLVACSIISALMQEYAITVKSSDVGLTWETHFKAKKQFQATDLKRIFHFCLQAFGELVKVEGINGQALHLFHHLLSIAQSVLSWGFISSYLPKRLIGVFESVLDSEPSPALRLGASWKDIILDPNVINLFFEIHWKVRENPDLSHLSLACLTQLASLNGAVVSAENTRIHYLTHYIQAFLKLVNSVQIMDREALGISNIVRKLLVYSPPPVLAGLPTLRVESPSSPIAGASPSAGFQPEEHLFHTFLHQMTKLTCQFAMGAALEESTCSEDHMYTEAFGYMLAAWTLVLHDAHVLPKQLLQDSSTQIFNTYLKCHLSPPDGNRGQGREIDVEEIDETEEDDRTKFKDQLEAIGAFGRQVLSHSLPLLSRLLEERTRRLQNHLQKMMQLGGGQNSGSHGGSIVTIADTSALDCLFEDIHWLVLIAGHTCCMVSEGETPLIPTEIMHHSMEQVSQYSLDGGGGWPGGGGGAPPIVEASLRLLASSPSLPPPPQESLEAENVDHVIRLVAAMFRVSEVERQAYESNLGHLLSPEVSCTLLWFLRRWALSYLLPNETFYSEMSMTLVSAFGRDTEAASWTVSFILSKVQSNLQFCGSEQGIIKDTTLLLSALVETKDKGTYVLKCEGLWNILAKMAHLNEAECVIPQTAKRGIYRALVLAGAAAESEQARSEYWGQLLRPLQEKFKRLICQENFARIFHQERIRTEFINLLESYIGVAQGSQASTSNSLFQYMAPILGELPPLLALTHNYSQLVQVILECYCEALRHMLYHLSQTDTQRMYEWCLQLIRTYASCSLGRRTIEASAEEEAYQDILLLMELLTNLLFNGFIELVSADALAESGAPQVSQADVILLGLSTLMPFVSPELLCFPSLCSRYFSVITFACEIFPGKMCSLPRSLSQPLLASVQLGLGGSYGTEAVSLCCDFIQVIGSHVFTSRLNEAPIYEDLRAFLKLFMSSILTQQFNSDLIPNASAAMYVLICCYQDDYQQMVQDLINSQTDPSVAQRLAGAFTDLTTGLVLNTERQNRLKFKDNFEKFITNVHGFLLVK